MIATEPVSAPHELSYACTVARELVHKRAVQEVFLTDSAELPEGRFLAAAQLPRSHALFSDHAPPFYDLLLALEVVRQAAVMAAHLYLGAPRGYQYVFKAIDLDVLDLEAARMGDEPAHATVALKLADCQYRDGVPADVTMEPELWIGDVRVVAGVGSFLIFEPDAYAALRAQIRAAKPVDDPPAAGRHDPLNPAMVGRVDWRNVVISAPLATREGHFRSHAVVNLAHPCLFDHQLDHLPGTLLLEAIGQTAIASACELHGIEPSAAMLTKIAAKFLDFGEKELPTECAAEVGELERDPSGRDCVPLKLALEQAGREIVRSKVNLTRAS